MANTLKKIESWFDERYNLSPLIEFIKHKKVPVHKHSVWYYMGGVTLFLFLVQVMTGILLLMYYKPGENSSYESVRFIITEVKFGWLIRSIHSWSANLMVLFAFLHMFSVFFTRAFQKPRELTWVSGFLLLAITMGFGFSGYLLPWDELAYFATKVGTEIVGAVPFVGETIKIILRGGEDVTGATLSRFFGIHVAILPLITTVLLAIHLLLVQRLGMHEPSEFKNQKDKEKQYMPFFPDFFLRDALLWLVVFNILIFLAVYFPWELGPKADPLTPAPAGIRPEWYFMFMFQSLKFLPAHILFIEGELFGVFAFGLGGLLWMLYPFLPFAKKQYKKHKIITFIIGVVVVIFIVVMTILGYII